MASRKRDSEAGRRRLIVNADDLGRSHSINQAILRAHREGILTTASLMVNEEACAEAVEIARANPKLGVGLHLTLLCGHSALSSGEIPGLVNAQNEFTNNATAAGFRYFFQGRLREQLRREIHEQFKTFRSFGLPMDHVNGHLHLHLHPVIFSILMEDRTQLNVDAVRLTHDPFWLNLNLARGRLLYRSVHAVIFNALAARARPHLERGGFKHTDQVFGLLQNGRVGKEYVCQVLNRLPPGDSELYSHPSLDDFKEEFEALTSPQVCEQVRALGIELIRYQDL